MTWLIPAAYALVLALFLVRYMRRRPRLTDYAPQLAGPLVSVIIPARDEAVNIEACVRSVLTTRYPTIEVIVVDDRSRDATPELVARLARAPEAAGRVRLVSGAELPPGWFGKSWALVQGYRVARGALLVFVDADTRHEPELLPRTVQALSAERVDLVSVVSRQEMVTFWERLIQPHVFVALAARVGDLRRVNRTRIEWDAIANGQYILTTRAAYEAVGTHAAVRASVAEDMALAQAFVRHHLDIFLTHGSEYVRTRMYRGLGGIVEGWTKNLATGVPHMLPPVRWLRRAAPYVMWLPALCWILPPLGWAVYGWPWAALTSVLSLVIWIAVYGVEGAPVAYALLYPLGAALVAAIMLRSAWRGARKVEWRGRRYGG
ncbi:MAG TPA: glycosyltransferase family 2 protein [Gemmatimonadales bacterium]|nr:glycosyltransferase family 2 protein [Gemmatimonadales bacterium]